MAATASLPQAARTFALKTSPGRFRAKSRPTGSRQENDVNIEFTLKFNRHNFSRTSSSGNQRFSSAFLFEKKITSADQDKERDDGL